MKLIKTIFIPVIGLMVASAVSSCDLTTESPSTFDEATVFSTPALTEFQLFSAYNVFGGTNSHRGRYLPYYGYNNDIEWNVASSSGDKWDIAMYSLLPNTKELNLDNGPYNELFNGIESTNLTIHGIRRYGAPESNQQMRALLGEALTLRAVLYVELLKAYGEVPARFEPVTTATLYINKSDKDVIYKQLLADLKEAAGYMSWPGESAATSTTGRVNRALAQGLYARIALMASGLSLRPDKGQVGTGNVGTIRPSDDEDLSKAKLYPEALKALKDVINNSKLNLVDYEELWRSVNNKDMTAGPGREIIWSIPFADNRGRWNKIFAIRSNSSKYSNSTNNGGQAGPVPYLYYMYGENDVRRDISCVNYEWEKDNLPYPAGIAKWYFGKYRFEWMQAQPYSGTDDDGVKPVYMRYSDILLMAAEIANEIGDVESNDGKDYLLEVRKRAYKGHEADAETYVSSLTDKEDFFNAIVDERALEFVGEFLRKADLIRWGMLKDKMVEAAYELQAFRSRSANSPKGIDYSTIGSYCWYRHGVGADGVPTIEMYGINPGENKATATEPPTAEEGWMIYTNSAGEATKYFVSTADTDYSDGSTPSFVTSGADKATVEGGFYKIDPDTNQWWPIPQVTITNSQGSLKNDYVRYAE